MSTSEKQFDVIIVGGGAAGFFAAITCAEQNPALRVVILERGRDVLEKVRVSGGGRCNVTNACYIPRDLVKNYPRGHKELLGPFHKFGPGHTVEWFENRGVLLKTENDDRIFPTSDNSQSIVRCLTDAARKAGVTVCLHTRVDDIRRTDNETWQVSTPDGSYHSPTLLITTGSNPRIWSAIAALGHHIVPPVPSLFAFDTNDTRLAGRAGVALPLVEISIEGTKFTAADNFLITHKGISGFAVLKLSAFAARQLAERQYKFHALLNSCPGENPDSMSEQLTDLKTEFSKKQIAANPQFGLPSRWWQSLVSAADILPEAKWADLNKKSLRQLAEQLTRARLYINGKSTHKDEFVTAGGISLQEVDFQRFESKLHPTLFFAGEVLDIDALTGGFNFQAAWTGAYLAGMAIAQSLKKS